MRPRGEWLSQHLQASSISELEMWLHHRPLTTPGDVALLVREGYLIDLGDGPRLTPKGHGEATRIEEARSAWRKKRPPAD